MAILPNVPGIAVTIHNTTDNDTAFFEHDAPAEMANWFSVAVPDGSSEATAAATRATAAKIVECTTDAEFRICVAFDSRLQLDFLSLGDAQGPVDVQARVMVDGAFVEDRLWTAREISRVWTTKEPWRFFIGGRSSVRGSRGKAAPSGLGKQQWTEKSFAFSHIRVCDTEDELPLQGEVSDRIGSIKVEIVRGRINKAAGKKRWKDVVVPESLPETKIKGKAISHGVALRQEKNIETFEVSTFTPARGEPVGVFEFCYRSKGCLTRLKVIPDESVAEVVPDVLKMGKPWDDCTLEEEHKVRQFVLARAARDNRQKITPWANEPKSDGDSEIICIGASRPGTQKTRQLCDGEENKISPAEIEAESNQDLQDLDAAFQPKDEASNNTARRQVEHSSNASNIKTEEPMLQETTGSTGLSSSQSDIPVEHCRVLFNNEIPNPPPHATSVEPQFNVQVPASPISGEDMSSSRFAPQDDFRVTPYVVETQHSEVYKDTLAPADGQASIDDHLRVTPQELEGESLSLPNTNLLPHSDIGLEEPPASAADINASDVNTTAEGYNIYTETRAHNAFTEPELLIPQSQEPSAFASDINLNAGGYSVYTGPEVPFQSSPARPALPQEINDTALADWAEAQFGAEGGLSHAAQAPTQEKRINKRKRAAKEPENAGRKRGSGGKAAKEGAATGGSAKKQQQRKIAARSAVIKKNISETEVMETNVVEANEEQSITSTTVMLRKSNGHMALPSKKQVLPKARGAPQADPAPADSSYGPYYFSKTLGEAETNKIHPDLR